MIAPPELDSIWNKWVASLSKNKRKRYEKYLPTRYSSVNRHYGPGKEFEAWLFDHGALVVQRDKKRYINFFSDEQALWFTLKQL